MDFLFLTLRSYECISYPRGHWSNLISHVVCDHSCGKCRGEGCGLSEDECLDQYVPIHPTDSPFPLSFPHTADPAHIASTTLDVPAFLCSTRVHILA